MKKLFFALSFSMIALIGQSNTAQAASNFNIGALGGIGILSNSGGSPFTYGLETDYKFDPSWSVGLLFNALTPNSVSVAGTSYTVGLSNLDLAIKYIMDQWSFGVLLGFETFSTNVPGASGGSYMNYGLVAGYDFQLGSNFSLGPQIDLLWNGQSGGYQETDILAAIKYWF